MGINMGGIDRVLRVVAGIALVLFALFSTSAYHWWGLIGIVPLLTGALGRCPLYALFGITTCRSG
jgi:sulfite exporter TauE/SafE